MTTFVVQRAIFMSQLTIFSEWSFLLKETNLVDLQTNSPLVFFEEWLENGWDSCNLSIECLEAHFHLGLGIFDFILSSQKIFGALGKLVFVLQSFKIGKVKVKGRKY